MVLFIRGNATCLFVQVLVCLAGVQSILSSNIKYKIRANCKIVDGYSMDDCTAGSLVSCVTKCTTRSGCRSVAWNRKTDVCMLSQRVTINDSIPKGRKYEEAADWTCASLVRFPVFRALDSTYATNRYQMSFPRASARCAELGTTLADPVNLTAAWNLGLQLCSCGWMSDGTNAVVLAVPARYCFGNDNTGVIRCGYTKADAWCMMP